LGDWNLFFATAAGSAATLVGLLFLATQLNLAIFKDPTNRWAALAQSSLTVLSLVFIVALFFLIPALDLRPRGDIIVIVVTFALWRNVAIWWPVVKIGEKGRRHRLAQSFWLLIVPVLVYVYLVTGAIGLIRGNSSATLTVASAFLALFAIALRNAWRLVVSATHEPV
jgi:uncharacterized membrane protein